MVVQDSLEPSVEPSFNQSPSYGDADLYGGDLPLKEGVVANGAGEAALLLAPFGKRWGAAEMSEHARLANEHPPRLQAFDAKGFRRDAVEYHPSYHHILKESIGASLHCSTFETDGTRADPPAEVERAARLYMVAQIECGHLSPIIMTRAALPLLRVGTGPAPEMIRKVVNRHYDATFRPWNEKFGNTIGLAMTERQGGTDLREIATRARPDGEAYALDGHKWFVSAPMSDAFLVLARAGSGIGAFLVPRFCPDGSINGLHFQRLKNKLGNRSNASVEVELRDALGWPVGTDGRGVATMMEMVQLARADCAVSSTGLMRAGLVQALHHARHRSVFGRRLSDQALMRSVLADLALEVEASLALVLRLARAIDLSGESEDERVRARFLTPACKYHIAKAAPAFLAEAMECLGGNGFIEDGVLPRLYREAPMNTIWEGSGNVLCLDVIRLVAADGAALRDLLATLAREAGDLPGVAETVDFVLKTLSGPQAEVGARAAVERLALLAAAAALAATGSPAAEAFARTRLAGRESYTFGAHDLSSADADRLLQRALPK